MPRTRPKTKTSAPKAGYLDIDGVREMLPIKVSRATVRRWIDAGCFIRPPRLGRRCVWREEDVQKYMAGLDEAFDQLAGESWKQRGE